MNDTAGDQALVRFDTTISVDDNGNETTTELFPQSTPDEIFELSFAPGTVTPGNVLNGSFGFDVSEGTAYVSF